MVYITLHQSGTKHLLKLQQPIQLYNDLYFADCIALYCYYGRAHAFDGCLHLSDLNHFKA